MNTVQGRDKWREETLEHSRTFARIEVTPQNSHSGDNNNSTDNNNNSIEMPHAYALYRNWDYLELIELFLADYLELVALFLAAHAYKKRTQVNTHSITSRIL